MMAAILYSDQVTNGVDGWACVQVRDEESGTSCTLMISASDGEGIMSVTADEAEAYAQKILEAVEVAREGEK